MYRPPEMIELYLRYSVNEKVDVWMLGCILYILCFYQHPFQEASKLSIINSGYYIPENSYSKELINFIKILLVPDPNKRPSTKELYEIMNEYVKEKKLIISEERLESTEPKRELKESNNKHEMVQKSNVNNQNKKKDINERNGNKKIPPHHSNKLSIKQPLVDFTNEWGDFVQASENPIKNNANKGYSNEIDFNFANFSNENQSNNKNNQWGNSGSFMNAFKIPMPTSPKMEDFEERKNNLQIPYLNMMAMQDISNKKRMEDLK